MTYKTVNYKTITYKNVSLFTASITGLLFLVLLIWPTGVLTLFQLEVNASAVFIARRAAILFAGFTILLWFLRHEKNSYARRSICAALATTMVGMALLGAIEFLRGTAGAGIWLAIVTELVIGFCFTQLWMRSDNSD